MSLKQDFGLPFVQQEELTVDVYAEDILFGETVFVTEDIFTVEDTSVAEEILDTISLLETET